MGQGSRNETRQATRTDALANSQCKLARDTDREFSSGLSHIGFLP